MQALASKKHSTSLSNSCPKAGWKFRGQDGGNIDQLSITGCKQAPRSWLSDRPTNPDPQSLRLHNLQRSESIFSSYQEGAETLQALAAADYLFLDSLIHRNSHLASYLQAGVQRDRLLQLERSLNGRKQGCKF